MDFEKALESSELKFNNLDHGSNTGKIGCNSSINEYFCCNILIVAFDIVF